MQTKCEKDYGSWKQVIFLNCHEWTDAEPVVCTPWCSLNTADQDRRPGAGNKRRRATRVESRDDLEDGGRDTTWGHESSCSLSVLFQVWPQIRSQHRGSYSKTSGEIFELYEHDFRKSQETSEHSADGRADLWMDGSQVLIGWKVLKPHMKQTHEQFIDFSSLLLFLYIWPKLKPLIERTERVIKPEPIRILPPPAVPVHEPINETKNILIITYRGGGSVDHVTMQLRLTRSCRTRRTRKTC